MTKSKEDAVSPVIGVILMVAVTVILAAVIAAFVFGMGSGAQKAKVVAATSQVSGDNIIITYQGGPNHNDVKALTAKVTASAATPTVTDPTFDTLDVGETATFSMVGFTGPFHVSVAAEFTDGTNQIILDTNLGPTGVVTAS